MLQITALNKIDLLKHGFFALLLTAVIYFSGLALYNIFFHPLSRYPGPVLWAVSRIPYSRRHINGTLAFHVLKLHQKYGNIVRVAPDELAFSHPEAWKDIMGHNPSGQEFQKATWFYRPIEDLPNNLVSEDRQRHGQLRRQLAHGFSEKSMRDQEPIIKQYVDLLIQKLQGHCKVSTDPVVLSDWYNFTTFDIIGDLAFGEPFGCLKNSTYHEWIKTIFQSGRLATILQMLTFVPHLKKFLLGLAPKSARDGFERQKQLLHEKMKRRIENVQERPDLIEGLLRKRDELNLSIDSVSSNAEILIIAGSETTATLLSGATFYLLRNPEVLRKVTEEVRESFKTEDEITLISVGQLTYMLACLNEALRMYPPIANGLPRVVPEGGAQIIGNYVPEKTYVAVHQWALYHREEYFKEPDSFHPERFLGDPKFDNDRRDALQPFHVGPRNCLGRNLAYSEMRLILARILYNFDLRLADESNNWIQQKNFLMWEKGPLRVYLTPVGR